MKNEITFDYGSNPELAEVFSRKAIGDKCSLTIDFELMEKDTSTARASITKITVPDYGPSHKPADSEDATDSSDEKTMDMNGKQPVAVVVMSK